MAEAPQLRKRRSGGLLRMRLGLGSTPPGGVACLRPRAFSWWRENATASSYRLSSESPASSSPPADKRREPGSGAAGRSPGRRGADGRPRRPPPRPFRPDSAAVLTTGGFEHFIAPHLVPVRGEMEKSVLTDEEFEEIVQIVLHKPFKECFDMPAKMRSGLNFAEAYSAQSIVCTQSDKEPGIATSATDNDNTDGESVMVSHATEISASVEDEVIPAIRTCPCLIWVQCSSLNCEKWRRLRGNIDPSVLPDDWSCDQNTDLDYNRCDIPEETWTEYESDVVYASYVPGSIIWAKQYGYPWWPGMVESDPDLGEYFFFNSPLDSVPSKYHVTFFGETVSRAWVPVSMLKNFQELSLELTGVKKCKNKEHIQKLGAAIKMAQKAKQTSFQERVNLFGFWSRYSGSDSNGEGKGHF
ncbi:zinc finger CW-type PWWP domain protein 1 [Ctenodactylus gundi]